MLIREHYDDQTTALSLSAQHRQITEFIPFFLNRFFFILVFEWGYVFVELLPLKVILSTPRTTDEFVCNIGDLIPGRHRKTHVLGENLSRDNVSVTKTTCKSSVTASGTAWWEAGKQPPELRCGMFVPTQHAKDTTSYVTRDGLRVCTGCCLDRCNQARPPPDGLSYEAKLTDHLFGEWFHFDPQEAYTVPSSWNYTRWVSTGKGKDSHAR
jgi:hypothetical protein